MSSTSQPPRETRAAIYHTDEIDTLAAELERDEGLRLKPYRCTAGKTTIGVGRNLDDVGITEDEARYLLRNDISRVLGELENQPWYHGLTGARRRAIANMCFNLGLRGLLGFRKMIAAIEAEDWDEAAFQLLESRYARQVGARADRLAEMLRLGDDLGVV